MANLRWKWLILLSVALLGPGCATPHDSDHPTAPVPSAAAPPPLTPARLAQLIPSSVPDRSSWASDIFSVMKAHHLETSPRNLCSVLAVIDQESNFHANPPVEGLAKIVEKRLTEYASKLGPLGGPALHALLKGQSPDNKASFETRLRRVKTERDLDRLFRDMLAYYHTAWPTAYAAANLIGGTFTSRQLEEYNPITTAGSMQVSVQFALDMAKEEGIDAARVRDDLYTRRGGLNYGIARLLDYPAHYPLTLYRYADYNAGQYSCRNAALQAQITRLTGVELTPDGDLLAYDKKGKPLPIDSSSLKAVLAFRARHAPELSEGRVRRDLRQEKSIDFEKTATWQAIKKAYQQSTKQAPPYARLPDVTISSPKLKGDRSSAWYARSVEQRYRKFHDRYLAMTGK